MQKVKYQIFISYRRDGGEFLARLLEYKLTERGFKVFFDVESLRAGAFDKALFDRIAECDVVLVVLPPHGLDRCADPDDWVRLEIARALKLKKKIIPIMIRDFEFPDTLPEDIDALRRMHGIKANNEFFEALIEKLISSDFLGIKPFDSDDQLRKEADEGNTAAMNTLGLRYESGSESLPRDRRLAFYFYDKAAKVGDPGALYNLGDVYERCEKDLSLVYEYGIEEKIFQKSAAETRKVLHQLAVNCYIEASKMNFTPATYRLANLAEEVRDFKTALQFYHSAADLNYPPAQNALGYYKMKGIETQIDIQAAIAWYKKAADVGYAPAVYNYAHSIELRKVDEAIQFYERVADEFPQAAFSLAQLYERNRKDFRGAINYYRIAYEAGIKEASDGLRRCQDKLFVQE